jgi:hypothetical protein
MSECVAVTDSSLFVHTGSLGKRGKVGKSPTFWLEKGLLEALMQMSRVKAVSGQCPSFCHNRLSLSIWKWEIPGILSTFTTVLERAECVHVLGFVSIHGGSFPAPLFTKLLTRW